MRGHKNLKNETNNERRIMNTYRIKVKTIGLYFHEIKANSRVEAKRISAETFKNVLWERDTYWSFDHKILPWDKMPNDRKEEVTERIEINKMIEAEENENY